MLTAKTLSLDKTEGAADKAAPWCLVMTLWGEKYGAPHVNELASSARAHSAGLKEVVLLTDRLRDGVAPGVTQKLFPPFFHRPDFFAGAYRAKLAMFSTDVLPKNRPCVYVDLDTVVTGDIGKIAALVTAPNLYFMMPPAGIGFGFLRRLIDRARGGRTFPTGNSSLVAFHSAAVPNLASHFQELFEAGIDSDKRYMNVDDVFISWIARKTLSGIPTSQAVMFRRHFLSRSLTLQYLRAQLHRLQHRHTDIAAITLNGAGFKPENLLALQEGAIVFDSKGRKAIWSDRFFGTARAKIIASCQRIVTHIAENP